MFLKDRGLLPILNQGDDDVGGEGKEGEGKEGEGKEGEEIEGMMEGIEEEEDVIGGDV